MIPTEIIIEAFKATMNFAGNMGKFDDNLYAENIIKLYGKEPTYDELDAQVEIIKNDPDMSTQEKLELLRAINVQKDAARRREVELKAKCAEIIDNGAAKRAETVTKVVVVIVKTLLTGGIALIPLLLRGNDDDTDGPSDYDDDDDESGDDVA